MAQYRAGQISALDATMHYDGFFAILGEEGNGDPGHDSILGVQCHATNFQPRGQMTFVIEMDLRRGVGSPARLNGKGKGPDRLLVYSIVRQSRALEKTREKSEKRGLAETNNQCGTGAELVPAALGEDTRTNCATVSLAGKYS